MPGVALVGAACVAGALLAEGDGLEDLGVPWMKGLRPWHQLKSRVNSPLRFGRVPKVRQKGPLLQNKTRFFRLRVPDSSSETCFDECFQHASDETWECVWFRFSDSKWMGEFMKTSTWLEQGVPSKEACSDSVYHVSQCKDLGTSIVLCLNCKDSLGDIAGDAGDPSICKQ